MTRTKARVSDARAVWPVVGLLLLVLGGLFWSIFRGRQSVAQKTITPLVMGTTSRLTAVGDARQLDAALSAAQAALESVNARMSTYLPESELSRWNRSETGTEIVLSSSTRNVLQQALVLSRQSDGAFDVTVRPLLRVWQKAGESGRLPNPEELAAAQARVGADKLQFEGPRVRKRAPGMEITLDAIAKGYAIHQAVLEMQQFGLVGGLVDVGGDIECFGRPLEGDSWRVAVQHPAADTHLLVLNCQTDDGTLAICTSGDYRRFVELNGQRYSHIIDPRTGQPARAASSVTVIGPTAPIADGWATACSVLGPQDGPRCLAQQPGLEALFVSGSPTAAQLVETPGFHRYIASSPPNR
jgi:thiamine biosynthesis lipoprotein